MSTRPSQFGERFREITSDREYFGRQHLHSAVEEAFGAKRLIDIVSELPSEFLGLRDKLLRHADEEIAHHSIFIEIFDTVFSEFSLDDRLRKQIVDCAPSTQSTEPIAGEMTRTILFMEIAQINIGEFRNLIQLKLAKPILEAHAVDEESRHKASQLMDGLISDEGGHVYYTARILEEFIYAGHGEEVGMLLCEGVQAFDQDARETMWPLSYGLAAEASIS